MTVRVYNVSGAGTAANTDLRVRVYRVSGTGSFGFVLTGPTAAQEPGQAVTLHATDSAGSDIVTGTWRVAAVTRGPKPAIDSSLGPATFTCPAVEGGSKITFGFAFGGNESFIDVTVMPATVFVHTREFGRVPAYIAIGVQATGFGSQAFGDGPFGG